MGKHLESVDSFSIDSNLELLGDICWKQRDYHQSLEYHLKALETREKNLAPDHRAIGNSLFSVGDLYEHLGNMKLAHEYYANSLTIYTQCLPEEHPTHRKAQFRIARTNLFIDRTDQTKVSKISK